MGHLNCCVDILGEGPRHLGWGRIAEGGVAYRNRAADLGEVGGHGAAHDPEANEACVLAHPSLLAGRDPRGTGLYRLDR